MPCPSSWLAWPSTSTVTIRCLSESSNWLSRPLTSNPPASPGFTSLFVHGYNHTYAATFNSFLYFFHAVWYLPDSISAQDEPNCPHPCLLLPLVLSTGRHSQSQADLTFDSWVISLCASRTPDPWFSSYPTCHWFTGFLTESSYSTDFLRALSSLLW